MSARATTRPAVPPSPLVDWADWERPLDSDFYLAPPPEDFCASCADILAWTASALPAERFIYHISRDSHLPRRLAAASLVRRLLARGLVTHQFGRITTGHDPLAAGARLFRDGSWRGIVRTEACPTRLDAITHEVKPCSR